MGWAPALSHHYHFLLHAAHRVRCALVHGKVFSRPFIQLYSFNFSSQLQYIRYDFDEIHGFFLEMRKILQIRPNLLEILGGWTGILSTPQALAWDFRGGNGCRKAEFNAFPKRFSIWRVALRNSPFWLKTGIMQACRLAKNKIKHGLRKGGGIIGKREKKKLFPATSAV